MKLRWFAMTGLWAGRAFLALLIFVLFAMGYLTPAEDVRRMNRFNAAVEQWQHNPDFRKVQPQYVEYGSEAMRTRVGGVDATATVMWLRSLPGLPEHLRVNPTSRMHYDNFSAGSLTSYIHLTGETTEGLPHALRMLKKVSRRPDEDEGWFKKRFTDVCEGTWAQRRAAMEKFPDNQTLLKDMMDYYRFPGYVVVKDEGALDSVRRLMKDVDVERTFAVDGDMQRRLREQIMLVARKNEIVEDPFFYQTRWEQIAAWEADADGRAHLDLWKRANASKLNGKTDAAMRILWLEDPTTEEAFGFWTTHRFRLWVLRIPPDRQLEMRRELDASVMTSDYELWRAKQVNDWLGGLWAQVYGKMYSMLIQPLVTLRNVSQILSPVMLIGWIVLLRRRQRKEQQLMAQNQPSEPRLAMEGPEGSAM